MINSYYDICVVRDKVGFFICYVVIMGNSYDLGIYVDIFLLIFLTNFFYLKRENSCIEELLIYYLLLYHLCSKIDGKINV